MGVKGSPIPLDLPRRVMRRALAVAALTLLAAVGFGLARTDADIDSEVRAAMSLAATMERLSRAGELSDAELVAVLAARDDETPLRHLSLSVRDATGRLLVGRLPETSASPWVEMLTDLHRRWRPGLTTEPVTWTLPRPGKLPWILTLAAQPDSERREAVVYLVSLLGVLLIGLALMMAAMGWNVRSAFRPLQGMLAAIARIQAGDTAAARAMPTMPIGELEQIAAALRSLGEALDAAQAERRLLGHKVQSLQEEERMRLSRELHDEFGQRLTAIRVDAAWLAQRLKDMPDALPVVHGMSEQCAVIQSDVRGLLARLQPLAGVGEVIGVTTLAELLQGLAEGWRKSASGALRVNLVVDAPPERTMPRDLALALYRISQEALTNVARHAQAGEVTLSLRWPEGSEAIEWSVADDGIGLADADAAMRRGSGLAGIKERVWAFGGDLLVQAAGSVPQRGGLRLAATLRASSPIATAARRASASGRAFVAGGRRE
jgi:two-component system sensor histidine kinase UhpB